MGGSKRYTGVNAFALHSANTNLIPGSSPKHHKVGCTVWCSPPKEQNNNHNYISDLYHPTDRIFLFVY